MKYKLKNICVSEGDIIDIPLDHIVLVQTVAYSAHRALSIDYFEEIKE